MNALMFSLIDASLANCRRSTPSRMSLSFAVGHHVDVTLEKDVSAAVAER